MEKERINQTTASRIIQQKQNHSINGIVDNRPYTSISFLSNLAVQRVSEEDEETMQGKFDSSFQRMEDEDEEPLQGKFESPVQRISDEDEDSIQCKFDKPIQKKNETGMPDILKAGIESLSGFSMDDVRVHYNSIKPATIQALAYTQGTDIHVAPGQEKYLPHEAWHVAQQMAGRVSPTTNINGMPVNDSVELEHEADIMGEKAVQFKSIDIKNTPKKNKNKINCSLQCKKTKQPAPPTRLVDALHTKGWSPVTGHNWYIKEAKNLSKAKDELKSVFTELSRLPGLGSRSKPVPYKKREYRLDCQSIVSEEPFKNLNLLNYQIQSDSVSHSIVFANPDNVEIADFLNAHFYSNENNKIVAIINEDL